MARAVDRASGDEEQGDAVFRARGGRPEWEARRDFRVITHQPGAFGTSDGVVFALPSVEETDTVHAALARFGSLTAHRSYTEGDTEYVSVLEEATPRVFGFGCLDVMLAFFGSYDWLWQDRDGLKFMLFLMLMLAIPLVGFNVSLRLGSFLGSNYDFWSAYTGVAFMFVGLPLTYLFVCPTHHLLTNLDKWWIPLGVISMFVDKYLLHARLGGALLLRTIIIGHPDIVNRYYAWNVDLDAQRGRDGATALILAVLHRKYDAARRLVQLGADINKQSNNGVAPLYAACMVRDHSIFLFLIENGADTDSVRTEQGTLLMYLSWWVDLHLINLLLDKEGTNLHRKRLTDHATALHLACVRDDKPSHERDHIAVAKALLDHEQDETMLKRMVNAQMNDGRTPLDICDESGFEELKYLLVHEYGAVHSVDPSSITTTVRLQNACSVVVSTHRLGSGTFGEVYLGTYRASASEEFVQVAVKHFTGSEKVQRFEDEIAVLSKLKPHPNIVRYLSASNARDAYVVLEYCDGGSLYEYLHETPWDEAPLNATLVLRWLSECANGLVFLHSQGVVHRDLKTANVLISGGRHGTIKLGDFGTVKPYHATEGASVTNPVAPAGTCLYQAPELYGENASYTERYDVYSIGIMMWECGARRKPFTHLGQRLHEATVIREVCSGGRPQGAFEVVLPDEYRRLMTECWRQDVTERPFSVDLHDRLERMRHT
mmetsp:Transcript_0/g.1  ORF Transcript_0/g.1 Transcript_0/m.1 type:complete len:715 (-) Transcript_0:89-2233(-)